MPDLVTRGQAALAKIAAPEAHVVRVERQKMKTYQYGWVGGALLFFLGVAGCGGEDMGISAGDGGMGPPMNGDGGTAPPVGTDPLPPLADDVALPIVFVHGFAGSAQQFQSQAMRFVANGYPAERLRAFDHDGQGVLLTEYASGTDAMIDEARATFKKDKVYLIGHSRGTSVGSLYLADPTRAAKVAKYIALDGAGCQGIPASVPCAAPAQTTNTRAGQTHPLPGQMHVEVATSKESFEVQFEFLFDKKPGVVDIVRQRAPVQISGRVVNFPANTGRDGATLDIWEIDPQTGMRTKGAPHATFSIGANGDFGPVTVDPEKYYEQLVYSNDSNVQQHFYAQRYLRSTPFVRVLSGPPDTGSRVNTNAGDGHAAVIALRMREWTPEDTLDINTESASGNQNAGNVITAATGSNRLALHLHDDAATPGQTTLAPLPWFPTQPFQTGADVFMPANDKPDGTITLTNLPRGDTKRPQTLRVPNWASTNHTIMVMFSDYAQD
jgi:pimeloyl-ACP methyl ester carboxylesterase